MALSREDKADVKGAMGKALANKVSKVTHDKPEVLNAWGQDAKTAKGVRKYLRQEKSMKSFRKGASARHAAGY